MGMRAHSSMTARRNGVMPLQSSERPLACGLPATRAFTMSGLCGFGRVGGAVGAEFGDLVEGGFLCLVGERDLAQAAVGQGDADPAEIGLADMESQVGHGGTLLNRPDYMPRPRIGDIRNRHRNTLARALSLPLAEMRSLPRGHDPRSAARDYRLRRRDGPDVVAERFSIPDVTRQRRLHRLRRHRRPARHRRLRRRRSRPRRSI